MDYFSSSNRFAHLSLADLLRARDQFHAHLVHKKNVIGTAVGRYLIRNDDPYPPAERSPDGKKSPRTLQNSGIRNYSWPCVLVFVETWVDDPSFTKGELPTSDYVPKTIYMDDGKAVPICLVHAPRIATPPRSQPAPARDENHLQGGQPIEVTVQQVSYRGTIGCLLTDGHKVYALTSRHLAGTPGEKLDGIGTTSAYQISRVPFESVYAPWHGKHTYVNLDVALVEVSDLTRWSSGIQSIGPIGPLAALSTYNLSVNLIGCPVRAHGAASGPMSGRIAALFYRYKSVGGFDYSADFLIGSDHKTPLSTLPGDSGALWVVDGDDRENLNRPIAVQWGGTVLGARENASTFALASNLSTICRELNVDVYRGPFVAAFEYWGWIGHNRIGSFSAPLVKDNNLRTLLNANAVNLGEIANYPDNPDVVGGRPYEGTNHYGDIDLDYNGIDSLDKQTPDAASLDWRTWQQYYKKIGGVLSEGLLPFRVWQIFKALADDIIPRGEIAEIVAGMGLLAHYVADACQPLHSSYFTHGDPFRKPDGTPVKKILKFKTGYGNGVHKAYESTMIKDQNKNGAFDDTLGGALPKQHGKKLVSSGRDAGWACMELMRSAQKTIAPIDIVNTYAAAKKNHENISDVLWDEFRDGTIATMVEGCRVLAMLWDSAWTLGGGKKIPAGDLVEQNLNDLRTACQDGSFLPSVSLGYIEKYL